ncbi:MAG TPA: YdeI/OmpD-associated family protein [Thermoleophilia bacterium]
MRVARAATRSSGWSPTSPRSAASPRAHWLALGRATTLYGRHLRRRHFFRRQYVYWVLDAKRPETRVRRVAETVRRAAAGLKPGESTD